MEKKLLLYGILIIAIVAVSFSLWAYWGEWDYSSKTKHETDAWGVIKDSKGDTIAIETTEADIWDAIINLHSNQTENFKEQNKSSCYCTSPHVNYGCYTDNLLANSQRYDI